jgi:hypothetical protein
MRHLLIVKASALSVSPDRKSLDSLNVSGARARTLNQEAAVVMPSGSTMSSMGVRFGSLGVGNAESMAQQQYTLAVLIT